mmetsp:Transcript_19151/g.42351  ORF Transcript_19151/g.42351 Transcript_19151/m.42351 type:complete len:332 (-) Transcript_19151:2655-3650(-)
MTRSPLQQATDCEQACCVPEQRSPQATQPTQHRRAVAMAQLPAVLVVVEEDLLPQLLKHHRGLVHCILLRPHVSQSAAHVLHETIQVVVIHLQHQMDILQGTTTIISGSSQCRNDVVSLLPLDTLQLGPFEEHVDPLVALNTLVQSVDHGHHTVKTSQALEQLVGPLQLVLLLRQLHTHCTPRCDIRPGAVQQDDRVVHGHLLHAHVKASGLKEVHHGIKMIVGDVAIVVGWAELGNVVGYLAAEAPSEIITELPSDLPLLRLGPLKMESHPGILNAPVEHVLDGGLHVLVAPEAVKQALTVFHDHTIHGVPAVAENVGADGLQGHQHLIN